MVSGPRSRFTIGNGMLVVAAIALMLGVLTIRGLAPVAGSVLIVAMLVIIGGTLVARRGLELAYGHRCPRCGDWGLERRAVVSFGERFFLCPSCGARCRRSLLGAYGLFMWGDASSPEYDIYYQKPVVEDPWNAPPGLEDEDMIYSKTHLNLVRNKRRRTPENPNGPGLE